jgi:hypothetical protein
MRSLLVALFLVPFVTARAGDLDALKAAARSYVATMDDAVTLQENSPECAIIASAKAYAATKIAYYDAATAALPALLQRAKGESSDNPNARELVTIFRSNGAALEAGSENALQYALTKCRQDPDATEKAKAELARAKKVAEDFVKDFGKIEGA